MSSPYARMLLNVSQGELWLLFKKFHYHILFLGLERPVIGVYFPLVVLARDHNFFPVSRNKSLLSIYQYLLSSSPNNFKRQRTFLWLVKKKREKKKMCFMNAHVFRLKEDCPLKYILMGLQVSEKKVIIMLKDESLNSWSFGWNIHNTFFKSHHSLSAWLL